MAAGFTLSQQQLSLGEYVGKETSVALLPAFRIEF
jgi:hypothetical protein